VAPLFYSNPHYYNADPAYPAMYTLKNGVPTNASDDETVFYVHPVVGATFQVQRRLQMNLAVGGALCYPDERILPKYYMPLFYQEDSTIMSDAQADKFISAWNNYEIAQDIAKAMFWGGFFGGGLCFVCGVIFCWRSTRMTYVTLEEGGFSAPGIADIDISHRDAQEQRTDGYSTIQPIVENSRKDGFTVEPNYGGTEVR